MPQDLCPQHAKNESEIKDLRRKQEQHDGELKTIIEKIAGLEANVMHLITAFDRHEKAVIRRIEQLEKTQSEQQVKDAKQDGKINLLWSFLIDKNGLVILGILTYIVLGIGQ
jgi:hypothetical protein